MSNRKHGDSAFPVQGYQGPFRGPAYSPEAGMSLREYYAGQALIGLLSRASSFDDRSLHVQQAFIYADLMLQEA